MRSALAILSVSALAWAGCGAPGAPSSNTGRAPAAGEGTLCPLPAGSCPDGLICAKWSSYQQSFGVCRESCDAGCLSGESCGTDGTCQCSPSATPGGSTDSCHGIGDLICHPNFRVCLPPADAGSCESPLVYSSLYSLCTPG